MFLGLPQGIEAKTQPKTQPAMKKKPPREHQISSMSPPSTSLKSHPHQSFEQRKKNKYRCSVITRPRHLCHGRWIPEKLQISGPAIQSTTKCHDRLSPNSHHSWPPAPSCTLRQQRMLHPPFVAPFQLQVFYLLPFWPSLWKINRSKKIQFNMYQILLLSSSVIDISPVIVITKMLVDLPSLIVSIRL